MPLRIRDYGEAHLKTDDDLFYFLQCATVATPKDPGWGDRAAEEVYALDRFAEYLRFLEKDEWFALRATSASKTRWTGKVRRGGREWEHASLALYLKREVSYWVQSVVKDMRGKGWL